MVPHSHCVVENRKFTFFCLLSQLFHKKGTTLIIFHYFCWFLHIFVNPISLYCCLLPCRFSCQHWGAKVRHFEILHTVVFVTKHCYCFTLDSFPKMLNNQAFVYYMPCLDPIAFMYCRNICL